jgi:hypothetical protein
MSNDEVTTVAADYMYLVILGDSNIIDKIASAMNEEARKNDTNKIYISTNIDTQVDYLPESLEFQRILIKDALQSSNKNGRRSSLSETISDSFSDDSQSNRKYFVMGEGVETAQCYTCGEGYVNSNMLIEIEKGDENFTIMYPVLNLDDEVNPEDLISSWVINNNITHIADNLNIRLVNMVGTDHDILVFAAYVNRNTN